MAIINSFPNNSDEYIGAEEVMRWLHGRTSGVYGDTGNAAVSAVQNAMAVSVAKGIGWLTDADGNGIVWWSGSATQLTIDAAEPTGTLNRIDRVIVRWYIGDYSDKPELLVLKGTNASVPTPPSINTDARYKEISLARVSIPAGTTEITNMLITDERLDPSVCGIVTESVTADTSMVSAQYADAVDLLESAIAEAWDGEISDGAITRAKLAPALLNEIGVHSVNGADGDVVLDAEDVGAMAEWTLLWENASPSSGFEAQTISLDLSDYDFVGIVALCGGEGYFPLFICPIDSQSYKLRAIMWQGNSSYYIGFRDVVTTTAGLTFNGAAYIYRDGGNGASSDQVKPAKIYGIKGVN